MPHPSKKARKARNRRTSYVSAQLREATARNGKLASVAINTYNQSAHLAKLLAWVVARYGVKGRLAIPDQQLAGMPDGAKLREHYDVESHSIILTSLVVGEEEGLLPKTEDILNGAPIAIVEAPGEEPPPMPSDISRAIDAHARRTVSMRSFAGTAPATTVEP